MPCGAVIVVQMLSLVKCRDIVVIVVMSCGAVIDFLIIYGCSGKTYEKLMHDRMATSLSGLSETVCTVAAV